MSSLRKRATVYFDPDIHRALKIKAAETMRSISEIVDDAIRRELSEDQEDLLVFEERAGEGTLSFDKVMRDLKARGKI